MPGLQNKGHKDNHQANSEAPSSQTMIVPIAANALNTIGPVLSTVSTAVGYSWSVNVAGTMIAANIGSTFAFAANTLNFWSARNDYLTRRNEIIKEVEAIPQIADSGVNSVTFVTREMPMDEPGYYFYKDQHEIWVFIRKNGESERIPLTENGGLTQNSPASLHVLLSIIEEQLESLSNEAPKPINGKMGIALAYLAESFIEVDPGLAHVKTLSEEQKEGCAKNYHYGVYLSQTLCMAACAVAAGAYGYLATSQTNTPDNSDANANEYIDPILPLGYISASIVMQSIGYCISTLAINSQNQKKAQLEKEYSGIRADRDKLQVTSNQKQRLKETIAYFSSFRKQVQGVGQRCGLLLENVNEMSEDLFKKLIVSELRIFLGILDAISDELKLGNLDEPVSFEIDTFKGKIIDLVRDINERIILHQDIGKKIDHISRETLSSIGNYFVKIFLQEEQANKDEKESPINNESYVDIQGSGNSPRFNA